MLQRKQTLWMLVVVICEVLTFKFSFYYGVMKIGLNGVAPLEVKAWPTFGAGSVSAGSGSILITIVTAFIITGTLINIFNFKARKKQFWISLALLFASLLNIFLYWWKSGVPPFESGNYSFTMILTLAVPVLLFVAARGIRKDEKLVKSADRLR
jgi:hypothetical protein